MDFTGSPLAILPCLLVTLRSVRAAIAKSEAERSTPLNGGSQWDSPNGYQTLLSRTVDTYTLPFTSRLAKSRFAKRNNIKRWPYSANNTLKRASLTETVNVITDTVGDGFTSDEPITISYRGWLRYPPKLLFLQ